MVEVRKQRLSLGGKSTYEGTQSVPRFLMKSSQGTQVQIPYPCEAEQLCYLPLIYNVI